MLTVLYEDLPREAQLSSRLAAVRFTFLQIVVLAFLPLAVQAQGVGCPTTAGNSVCLTTYQGSAGRLGFDPNEPALTQTAITATTGPKFHKQFSVKVNGTVYAQPLVLPNVTIGATTYADVVYVATEQDWVYAIDGARGRIIWAVNLAPAGYTYLLSTDIKGCPNILPTPGNVGITGTPVIDISGNQGVGTITSGVLYAVAKMKTTTQPYSYKQTLYAISVINGGNGVGHQPYAFADIGGTFNGITFNKGVAGKTATYSETQNQRGALLAVPVAGQNPQIVITWASHCDHENFPYNGWVMSYQLTPTKNALAQTAIWASVPGRKTYEGGIWQGGSGPAADDDGHIFLAVGNGDASVKVSTPPNDIPTLCSTTPCDYGNSIVEMQIGDDVFDVVDFFTAYDWVNRNSNDYDLGAGGVMLLPTQPGGNPEELLTQAGKEGNIYLAQTSPVGSLGGYTGNGISDATLQSINHVLCYDVTQECGVWGAPAWWSTTSGGGGSTGYAYYGGMNFGIMQFKFYPNGNSCTGTGITAGFCTLPSAKTSHTFGWPGPTPVVSAPNETSTQAIVWAIDTHKATNGGGASLWAFDAATLKCLYTTDQGQSRTACTVKSPGTDAPPGIAIKFGVPSVANGKVYVGTAGPAGSGQGYLNIYGIN